MDSPEEVFKNLAAKLREEANDLRNGLGTGLVGRLESYASVIEAQIEQAKSALGDAFAKALGPVIASAEEAPTTPPSE